jgi:hypothetical protein
MEIKGSFGVEMKNRRGEVERIARAPNTVVNAGALQVKRWLDRNEIVSAVPNYSRWRDGVVCAGELRRIVVAPKTSFPHAGGEYWWDSTSTYLEANAFDGYNTTMFYSWMNADLNNYWWIDFDEPLHLKGLGMIWQGDNNSQIDGSMSFGVMFKYDGFTVASASTTAYNGAEYLREFQDCNGHAAYKLESQSRYMFVNEAGTKWVLATALGGTADYQTTGTTLPTMPSLGTWEYQGGNGPNAPTVTRGTTLWRTPGYAPDAQKNGAPVTRWASSLDETGIAGRASGGEPADVVTAQGSLKYRMTTFEAARGLFPNITGGANNFGWYGYIPYVRQLKLRAYCNANEDENFRIPEFHIYEAAPHPQNPYALKLGTDDTAPDGSQTDLVAASSGMAWKCESVAQLDGTYTIRFSKTLDPDTANGVTFKEIGLFGNLDGHLPHKTSEPLLANASGLFARAVFDEPWSKASDQTATIYYDIMVG